MFTTWSWPSTLCLCMQLRSQRRDTGKWEQACGTADRWGRRSRQGRCDGDAVDAPARFRVHVLMESLFCPLTLKPSIPPPWLLIPNFSDPPFTALPFVVLAIQVQLHIWLASSPTLAFEALHRTSYKDHHQMRTRWRADNLPMSE